ncbi:chitin synthase [Malassezia vespertilionis]|nr:chitin synthase [Malassezia vespertilionis]WFD06047.1 chitin synthase [Malassezia vespertilionis]
MSANRPGTGGPPPPFRQDGAIPTVNVNGQRPPPSGPTLHHTPSVSFKTPAHNSEPRHTRSYEHLNDDEVIQPTTGPKLSRWGSTGNRDPESGAAFQRKRSLVRPERERLDQNSRYWFYRNHAAQYEAIHGRAPGAGPSAAGSILPSAVPNVAALQGPGQGVSGYGIAGPSLSANNARNPGLRRGKSILGRDEDKVESGIHFLRRGVSMRRTGRGNPDPAQGDAAQAAPVKEGCMENVAPGPVGVWMIYCYFLTICAQAPCLRIFGIKTPEQQRAWREKIGLIGVILLCMGFVGYITFGFTETVCGVDQRYDLAEIRGNPESSGMANLYGEAISLDKFRHIPIPNAPPGFDDVTSAKKNGSSIVYSGPFYTAFSYLNLMFPVTGGACDGLLTPTTQGGTVPRYFECGAVRPGYLKNPYNAEEKTKSTGNILAYHYPQACHSTQIQNMVSSGKAAGTEKFGVMYFKWADLEEAGRNESMTVWRSNVIDLSLLDFLLPGVTPPPFFAELRNNPKWIGRDITAEGMRTNHTVELDCLASIARVASIDVDSPGCIASKVELVLSMIFIVGAVAIKFIMAVMFAWCLSWRIGNYDNESYAQRMKRVGEIETWTDDIYRPAPAGYRPTVKKTFLPKTSRFTYHLPNPTHMPKSKMSDKKVMAVKRNGQTQMMSPPTSPTLTGGRSSASLAQSLLPSSQSGRSMLSTLGSDSAWGPCPWPLDNVVPQPPPNYQPFNFPLVHSICLVTAYSESFEGLRTTLDSLATTNYPNSHKLILIIADGIVKGAESDISTPDICLSMMKELIVPAEDVEGYSYVAIADGPKRHNMAKVYAGFYDYDDQTVERSKQQRIPVILVAKCGSLEEMDSAKPGNRGKRDSQVLLMAFLQKVLFDERMTLFEYEFFNAIWRVTGVTADMFEIILMVDADTKVFPDSLTHMVAAMVEDPEIMGLCGETKIANKSQSWVTMIQVFEYYISHHQTKGFESCFGGVTCLPGCFSAYRIKSPKGPKGFYVPILANPDVVEHYSENVVDTLHKKNLLLLGEDRYLTTLMLMIFPRRKMMFLPSAVCKTVVPETFKVLRSQRRRWINSTVHNLFELIQVRDLCGTFCFSMRFVVFMDLVGTMVLPAAIAFTFYVVISAIIIGVKNGQEQDPAQKQEFPTMPLVLLALILGLPGVLIVLTSRRFMYVMWMLIYLLSLPIWNLVLPAYAFWHMDDFSWGATRMVAGEKKGDDGHSAAVGDFNVTTISMKRWAEYERERRLGSGLASRDGADSLVRYNTPDIPGVNRFDSQSSDNSSGGNGNELALQNKSAVPHLGPQTPAEERFPRLRKDSVPLLELPAPLGADTGARPRPPAFTNPFMGGAPHPHSHPDASVQARQHLFGPTGARPPSYTSPPLRPMPPGYAAHPYARGGTPPRPVRPGPPALGGFVPQRPQRPMIPSGFNPAFAARGPGSPPSMSPTTSPPGATSPPMRLQHPVRPSTQPSVPSDVQRVSLSDDGPVLSTGSVRQVVRGARRQTSQASTPSIPPFDASFGGSPFDK